VLSRHTLTQIAAAWLALGYGYSWVGLGFGAPSEAGWLLFCDLLVIGILLQAGRHWIIYYIAAVLALQCVLHTAQLNRSDYNAINNVLYFAQYTVIGGFATLYYRRLQGAPTKETQGPHARWMLTKKL